jgi:hypothetical protein
MPVRISIPTASSRYSTAEVASRCIRKAQLLPRMGASIVVFTTTDRVWNEASLKAVNETFASHPDIEIRKWTSAILYG